MRYGNGTLYLQIKLLQEPRDLKLEAEILSQKIAMRSEFTKNNQSEKYIFGCKILTVREKKIPLTLSVWYYNTPILQIL
jgi:hypothetical protein